MYLFLLYSIILLSKKENRHVKIEWISLYINKTQNTYPRILPVFYTHYIMYSDSRQTERNGVVEQEEKVYYIMRVLFIHTRKMDAQRLLLYRSFYTLSFLVFPSARVVSCHKMPLLMLLLYSFTHNFTSFPLPNIKNHCKSDIIPCSTRIKVREKYHKIFSDVVP